MGTASTRLSCDRVDGEVWRVNTFTAMTLGEEFATGLTGSCVAPDFPDAGSTTTLEWQEGLQGFVVTEVQ